MSSLPSHLTDFTQLIDPLKELQSCNEDMLLLNWGRNSLRQLAPKIAAFKEKSKPFLEFANSNTHVITRNKRITDRLKSLMGHQDCKFALGKAVTASDPEGSNLDDTIREINEVIAACPERELGFFCLGGAESLEPEGIRCRNAIYGHVHYLIGVSVMRGRNVAYENDEDRTREMCYLAGELEIASSLIDTYAANIALRGGSDSLSEGGA